MKNNSMITEYQTIMKKQLYDKRISEGVHARNSGANCVQVEH